MSIVEMKVPVIGESINEVTLSTWLKDNGDYIELDEPICAPVQEVPAPATTAAPQKESYAAGHPSPSASKILAEKGIAPGSVAGTGRDGRITKEDAQAATKVPSAAPTPAKSAPTYQPSNTASFSRDTKRELLTK